MTLAGRNALLFIVARSLSLLIPLMSLPMLGRALGPHGVGLLAYSQAFIQYFAVMVDFGFGFVSISTVARHRSDLPQLRKVFWSIYACRFAIYLACLPLVFLGVRLLAADGAEIQVMALSTLLLTGVLLTPSWLYQGLERGTSFVALSLLPRLLSLPLIWMFVKTPEHANRAAMILWGAELIGGIGLFVYGWWRLVPGRPLFDKALAREESKRASDAWLGAVVTTAIANINPLVIRELAGMAAVGLFSAADRIVRVVHSLLYPIVLAYQAHVTRLWGTDPRAAGRFILRALLGLMALATVFFLAMQVLGLNIVTLLFGPSFAPAAEVLHVYAAFPVFAAASTTALYFLYYANDKGRLARPWFPALLLLHCLLLWALVPVYQATGAAVAILISECALGLVLWLRARSWLAAPSPSAGFAVRTAELHDPRVSIVICNYNYARFLPKAIESALSQTRPCEVIVVDDGSKDESRSILTGYADRVHLILQPNGGQNAAYNAGFEVATGEIVIFLDSDDYLEPDAAQTLATAFTENVVKVHYRMRLVDAAGQPLGGTIPHAMASGNVLTTLLNNGVLYASAPGSGNAYRRSVLQRLFPLPVDPVDRHGADFFTVYGCIAFGEVRAIERPLACYRVHESTAAAAASLAFGNAATRVNEDALVRQRAQRLRALVLERTQGAVQLPANFLDFSRQKSSFAAGVIERSYFAGIGSGLAELPLLWKALWLRPEMPLIKKSVLSLWALVVIFAPRPIAVRAARHVCNPSSRRA
jgi:O-antigen/teichoic acid export membrane protein